MDRIKRLSYQVLEQHRSKFSENFADNKKLLEQLTIIRSKGLKNKVAGYITKFIKSENYDKELKAAREAEADESEPIEEVVLDPEAPVEEETVIEVGVETPETPEPVEAKSE